MEPNRQFTLPFMGEETALPMEMPHGVRGVITPERVFNGPFGVETPLGALAPPAPVADVINWS